MKLSDLERQSPIVDLAVLPRMTRSIPESSWVEEPLLMSRSMGYRSVPRPLEPEPASLTDSCTSETGESRRRLGTDLLRMFLEEIDPDVRVKVAGRMIQAHRCILISRCQYFAGTLSGHRKDENEVIHLRGFSYEAVYFAMCHIYSGAAHVPDSISLEELAALSDFLSLEGLKEVVAHALKTRHCHNFHSPCPGCLSGVPEVLPLAAAHGLDELYRRCLQWLTQHYERCWPTKSFASLPRELREKCLQQHLVHMTADSVLETSLACDRFLAAVPQQRWSESVVQLGLQLAEACQMYLRQHLVGVLTSPTFHSLDSEQVVNVEEQILAATEALVPEQACRSYARCHKMLDMHWGHEHLMLLRKLDKALEQGLAARADKATRCPAWQRLEPALRARIREASRPSRLPRASSSDSSRTSSPAASRAPAGSPSLRRSLLLAARAPQIPASPSVTRRSTSSVTRPTQSSAAKSAPSRNVRPTIKSPVIPRETNRSVVAKKDKEGGKLSTNTVKRETKQQHRGLALTPTVVRKPSGRDDNKGVDVKSPSKAIRSPSKTTRSPVKGGGVSKSPSRSNVCKSPSKATRPSTLVRSPTKGAVTHGMTRSETFLKEEPTVLSRVH